MVNLLFQSWRWRSGLDVSWEVRRGQRQWGHAIWFYSLPTLSSCLQSPPVPVVYMTPWQVSPWMFSSPSPTHFRANRLLQRGPRSVGVPHDSRAQMYLGNIFWEVQMALKIYSSFSPSALLRLGHHFLLESWGREKEKEQTPSGECCSCFWASCLRSGTVGL